MEGHVYSAKQHCSKRATYVQVAGLGRHENVQCEYNNGWIHPSEKGWMCQHSVYAYVYVTMLDLNVVGILNPYPHIPNNQFDEI